MWTREAHLPPRCASQKKPTIGTSYYPISSLPTPNEYYPRLPNFSTESSVKEEKPDWLDGLLSDLEAHPKGTSLRRSASDSVTLLDGIADSLTCQAPLKDEKTLGGVESGSIYGPNSPRQRCSSAFSENGIASALSKYVPEGSLQYVDGSLCVSGTMHSGSKGEDYHSNGEPSAETKALMKRHSGQRSRVRKLQYIAELERTLMVLETLQTDLKIRVSSQLQQHMALSMENNKLKQQLVRLCQQKLIKEGQYHSLNKELKRLKSITVANNARMYAGSSPARASRSEAAWEMLDIGKLNLN